MGVERDRGIPLGRADPQVFRDATAERARRDRLPGRRDHAAGAGSRHGDDPLPDPARGSKERRLQLRRRHDHDPRRAPGRLEDPRRPLVGARAARELAFGEPCAVQRRRFPVGANPTRQLVAPAGSNRSGGGGNEAIGASGVKGRLELAPEKTRMLLFGRFARETKAEYGKKPETFEVLGFKHVCGTDVNGKTAIVRIPSTKSCRKFLDRTHEWLRRHMHWKRRDQQRHLASMLRGFYQYFALNHCMPKLYWLYSDVRRQWRRSLRRRSQRHRMFWSYLESRSWFELPTPKLLHPSV